MLEPLCSRKFIWILYLEPETLGLSGRLFIHCATTLIFFLFHITCLAVLLDVANGTLNVGLHWHSESQRDHPESSCSEACAIARQKYRLSGATCSALCTMLGATRVFAAVTVPGMCTRGRRALCEQPCQILRHLACRYRCPLSSSTEPSAGGRGDRNVIQYARGRMFIK